MSETQPDPEFGDIGELTTICRDLAEYSARLIQWAHSNEPFQDEIHSDPDRNFCYLRHTYADKCVTPDLVPQLLLIPQKDPIVGGISGPSMHHACWSLAERVLQLVANATDSELFLGLNPNNNMTQAEFFGGLHPREVESQLRTRLRTLPVFDAAVVSSRLEKEAALIQQLLNPPPHDQSMLLPADALDFLCVENNRTNRKRLDRWRKKHPAEQNKSWLEATDMDGSQPRYRYQPGAVRHLFRA